MYENQTFDPRRYRVKGDYEIFIIFIEDEEEEYLDLDNPEDDAL